MSEADFHERIIQSLASLETNVINVKEQTVEIKEHLQKLNGSVVKVASDLAKHPYECKYGIQIEQIERQLVSGEYPGSKEVEQKLNAWNLATQTAQAAKEASQKNTAKWLAVIKPVLWVIVGAFIYILLTHLDELLRFYKVKP